ncbi:MAG: transglutaminase domain-containing protein, partial [Terriglobia bacterium]
DYATAEQTLATLEADCLEFSQLYVAMARSLGLPARMVSGLAYSGTTFGGHAWVEVYVGDWIELDPTWGTDFVDATHIRNSASGALLTYASLNLVEFEVLEAPRGFAEFQKDPRALAAKLCEELPKGNVMALTSALDLAILTDENVGLGTWDSLSDSERDVMSSAYRRLLLEISIGFRKEADQPSDLRLLKVKESGEKAEAVLIHRGFDELLVKFSLVNRNGAWFLTEILQTDTDLHIISETLQPTIKTILDRRNNKSARGQSSSAFLRVLLVLEKDPKAAVAIADRALKDDPKNRGVRHAKALALARNEKEEDAIQLWEELAGEAKPFAPALLSLARQYAPAEDKAKQKLAIEFYTRYGEAEPEDPRTHIALARLYDASDNDARAEAEHAAALKSDPSKIEQFVEFAAFLAIRKRFKEAVSVIDEADKKATADDDLFGDLMTHLYYMEDKTVPEELALSQPQRMDKSATANLYLAYVRLGNGGSLRAIPLLKKAAALKKDWSEPYGAMANGYRALRNWTAALNAANTAIKIDADYSDAHFSRACALARLGRIKEALQSLEKAVELDPDLPEIIGDEADLRVLASRPAFKKLLVPQEPKQ